MISVPGTDSNMSICQFSLWLRAPFLGHSTRWPVVHSFWLQTFSLTVLLCATKGTISVSWADCICSLCDGDGCVKSSWECSNRPLCSASLVHVLPISWSLDNGSSGHICELHPLALWQVHRRNLSWSPWHISCLCSLPCALAVKLHLGIFISVVFDRLFQVFLIIDQLPCVT